MNLSSFKQSNFEGACKGHFDTLVSWDNHLKRSCQDASERVPTSFDVSIARTCQVRSHLKRNLLPEICTTVSILLTLKTFKDDETAF